MDLSIFPNPASTVLYIKTNNKISETYAIKIFNTYGTLIQAFSSNNETVNYNISNLNRGIYFIEILSKSTGKITKLIIQ